MTMQTPPLSAFAKPSAIFFGISNNGLPLEPLTHTFIEISNYPTREDANSTPLGFCTAIQNFSQLMWTTGYLHDHYVFPATGNMLSAKP